MEASARMVIMLIAWCVIIIGFSWVGLMHIALSKVETRQRTKIRSFLCILNLHYCITVEVSTHLSDGSWIKDKPTKTCLWCGKQTGGSYELET